MWRRKWILSRNCAASLAAENYVPPGRRELSWHPVILDEMTRKDVDLSEAEAVCICA